MAVDITGYLLLEKDSSGDFIGGRNISHIIQLDEGHDRSVWEWIKAGDQKPMTKGHVPSVTDRILLEGVEFLATFGQSSEIVSDAALKAALDGYLLTVVFFADSSLAKQLSQLDSMGLAYKVLRES